MATQEQIFKVASNVLGRELTRTLLMEPREAAEGAYLPGGPSVDELEQRIRDMRQEHAVEGVA